MTASTFYIGMDLGGTTFKALAVTAEGEILGRTQGKTESSRPCEMVVQDMVDAIHDLEAKVTTPARRLAAVGIGAPGILDLPAGIIRRSPNLLSCEGHNLRELMQQQLTVPLAIENDANAALLGEVWLGAGRGMQNVVMLTLGTGVGGGVLINGEILHGTRGYGGEIGHIVVDPNGPPCGCGSHGCLEQFASGTAVARLAKPHYGEITSIDVAEAARRGESHALGVFQQVGHYLGIACASFAHLFNPQCVIIGGAVANAFDLFIDVMQTTTQRRTFGEVYQTLRIVPATCGTDAGGQGAAQCGIAQLQNAE